MDDKLKKYFSEMGKKGVAKRFKGLSKEEISKKMKKVRGARKRV